MLVSLVSYKSVPSDGTNEKAKEGNATGAGTAPLRLGDADDLLLLLLLLSCKSGETREAEPKDDADDDAVAVAMLPPGACPCAALEICAGMEAGPDAITAMGDDGPMPAL